MKFVDKKIFRKNRNAFLNFKLSIVFYLFLIFFISNCNSRITSKNIKNFNDYVKIQKSIPFSLTNIHTDQLFSKKISYTFIKTTTKTVTEVYTSEIKVNKDCGIKTCPLVKFEYELSSYSGKFNLINRHGLKNFEIIESREGKKSKMKFSVDNNPLTDLFDRFTFDYNCPFIKSLIRLKITAKPKFAKDTPIVKDNLDLIKRNVDNIYTEEELRNFFLGGYHPFENTNSKIQSTKKKIKSDNKKNLKIYSDFKDIKFDLNSLGNEPKILFDGYVDISLSFSKFQYLKAIILSDATGNYSPVGNTEAVIKTINFPKCPELRMKTDNQGKLNSKQFKVFDTFEKINYSIEFIYRGFKRIVLEFSTGGFGFSELIDLGKIILIKENISKSFIYKGRIINSLTNRPEEKVKIRFLTLEERLSEFLKNSKDSKIVSFSNKTDTKIGKNLNSNTKVKNAQRKVESNSKGEFEIKNLKSGVYFLRIKKKGFNEDLIGN